MDKQPSGLAPLVINGAGSIPLRGMGLASLTRLNRREAVTTVPCNGTIPAPKVPLPSLKGIICIGYRPCQLCLDITGRIFARTWP